MEKMISAGEAARIKGVSTEAIRKAIRDGRLKGYQSGKFFLVDAESLEQFQVIGHRPKKIND